MPAQSLLRNHGIHGPEADCHTVAKSQKPADPRHTNGEAAGDKTSRENSRKRSAALSCAAAICPCPVVPSPAPTPAEPAENSDQSAMPPEIPVPPPPTAAPGQAPPQGSCEARHPRADKSAPRDNVQSPAQTVPLC